MTRSKVIIHPTDFFEHSHTAFEYALGLAGRQGATLHIVHVTGGMGEDPIRNAFQMGVDEASFYEALEAHAGEKMKALVEEAEDSDVPVRRATVHSDSLVNAICTYAERHDGDTIVMGTHGRDGVSRWLLGSVAEDVVRNAPCSVLTLRADSTDRPETVTNVLVPLDLSVFSRRLVKEAKTFAATLGARVDLLHVIEPLPVSVPLLGAVSLQDLVPNPVQRFQQHLDQLASAGGEDVPVGTHIREGHAASTIIDAAEEMDADLIVMASHGLSGLERVMLGSVTARVIRRSPIPVLTVPVTEEWADASETYEKAATA